MRKYGLIGFPLEHSFSKSYFEKKINELQIEDVNYENYELDDGAFDNFIGAESFLNDLQTSLDNGSFSPILNSAVSTIIGSVDPATSS